MKQQKKILLIAIMAAITIAITPFIIHAQGIVPQCGGEPCTLCDFYQLIKNFLDFLTIKIALPLAIVALIIGGVLLTTSAGSQTRIEKGKKAISAAVIGLLITFGAWLIVGTILNALGAENLGPNSLAWNKFPTCAKAQHTERKLPQPIIKEPTPITGGGEDPSCNIKFSGVSSAIGACQQNNPAFTCTSMAIYKASGANSCAGTNGQCLMSVDGGTRMQKLVNTLNSLTSGACTISITSTIQSSGGPSSSSCHRWGTDDSGSCADVVLSNYESCIAPFKQAAAMSGVVTGLLDEYQFACKSSGATGDHIHITFSQPQF